MLSISHYVGQFLDAFSLCVFFLLLFKLSPDIRTRRNYLIALVSVVIVNIADSFYNTASILLLGLVSLLFIKDTTSKLHLLNSFIVSLLFTLLSTRFAYLANMIVFKQYSGILHANWGLFIIIFIIVFSLSILVLLFFYTIIMKIIDRSKLDANFSRMVIFCNALILLIVLIIAIIFTRAFKIETTFLPITLLISTILLIATSLTVVVLFSKRIRQLEAEHQKKIEADTQQYIKMLEASYENLKRSRHDFKNTLLSIGYLSKKNGYIKAYDAINEVLHSQLLATNIDSHNLDLNRIKDELLRSIIAQKVDEAESKNITTVLEFDSNIPMLNKYRTEIVRIVGILFDNAIEAAEQSNKRIITIAITNIDDNIELSIRNSVPENLTIDMNKIFKLGFSTKGDSRGIGLATVKKLIAHFNNEVLFNVSHDERTNEFTVSLFITIV